jgi:tyrosyl-tRNA synthetase
MKKFVDELRWRGMIHDVMPGLEEHLEKKGMASAYLGFDPTADSLHIGHLVGVMTLVHFQRSGHKPYALVGGATGMIGDPSFKSDERVLLSKEQLDHNIACIQKQLGQFLDFEGTQANKAELVNNYDWMSKFSFLDFIREVGKHITVNYMMAKDSVKRRLEDGNGLSFTEFTYQLIQGYDFLHLFKENDCTVQLGGSDQWGNITTGTELIRRMEGGEAYALTVPLIKKADGTKFGKTESGSVWLDPEKTSPYAFYQFWLNATDVDVESWIKIFSLKSEEEINRLIETHTQAPHERLLQKALGEELTVRVHGRDELDKALQASEILFGKGTEEALGTLDEKLLLSVFEGVPQGTLARGDWEQVTNVTDLLSVATDGLVFSSKGEARKMIQGGGVSINKQKISDPNQAPIFRLIRDKYLLVQRGKKNYYLIRVD